jgi:hypothetical protein
METIIDLFVTIAPNWSKLEVVITFDGFWVVEPVLEELSVFRLVVTFHFFTLGAL